MAATVVLVLLSVEVGARILLPRLGPSPSRAIALDNPSGTRTVVPSWRGNQVLHPYLGFVVDPHQWPGADPSSEPSRYGFPFNSSARLFFEPSDDRLIVAVLGGSVASIAAHGSYDLERELVQVARFQDREIVVLSLATGSYKQPQQLMSLAYLLALGAHFDLVLNLDGFNEVALSARAPEDPELFPFYPRDWDQRVGEPNPRRSQVVAELSWQRERRRRLARQIDRSVWGHSGLVRVYGVARDRGFSRRIVELESEMRSLSRSASWSQLGPERSYTEPEAMLDDLVEVWAESSRQIDHLCRRQGIEYHHFLQPNQYDPGNKPLAAEREAGFFVENYRFRRFIEEGYPRLREAGEQLRREGVAFSDLSTIFAQYEELLYADRCCHLNERGNRLLKRAMAESLAEGDFRRPENVGDSGLALEGFDPTTYFEGPPRRGSSAVAAEFDGLHYRFVDEEHRRRFLRDPARYRPRFGGWCAYSMATARPQAGILPGRYPVDPENFVIHDDRLYLFFRNQHFDARGQWLENPDRHLREAERTWRRLQGVGSVGG